MKKFDTKVQHLKYKVIKEVIKKADANDMQNVYKDVPNIVVPGPKASMRCCIYKERAIVQERIKMALGGNKENPNVVEVIDIACDECPIEGMLVTSACRGCIVNKCSEVCPRGAITIINKMAVIDKEKCIECGMCTKVCPYSAIIEQKRPCVKSCKIKAISMGEDKKAIIDNEKCIICGSCIYHCPFGAIVDKSLIMDVLSILKNSDGNYNVYAVVAPSIASQFKYAKVEQVVTGIKMLGFHKVVEAALGADITLKNEIREIKEKGIMTTSCCPSFVMFIEKNFPEFTKYISSSLSPMIETAKVIKSSDPSAKVIFVGPCTSKKAEYKMEKAEGMIDSVISFEELQAFFDARDIDITSLEDTPLDDASYYGRIFAKSGGIAMGIKDFASETGIEITPIAMNGIEECKMNLLKLKADKATENFFEGMACDGGCLNGALCLSHETKNAADIDKYADSAKKKL